MKLLIQPLPIRVLVRLY